MKLVRTTGSGRVRYYQLDFKIKNIKGGFMPVSFAEIEAINAGNFWEGGERR
jgi:hypothetical protein